MNRAETEPNPYFGDLEGVPATEGARRVTTPTGARCLYCREAVRAGDSGYLMASYEPEGARVVAVHAECQLRQVVGGVECLKRQHAGTHVVGDHDPDPPGLSRREAAQATWAWIHEHGLP